MLLQGGQGQQQVGFQALSFQEKAAGRSLEPRPQGTGCSGPGSLTLQGPLLWAASGILLTIITNGSSPLLLGQDGAIQTLAL